MDNSTARATLEKLIAYEVFKECIPARTPESVTSFWDNEVSPLGAWELESDYETGDIPRWVPMRYSSDLNWGFRVVTKINARFNTILQLKQIPIKDGSQWVCLFTDRETEDLRARSLPCSNPAWAICEAAITLINKTKKA